MENAETFETKKWAKKLTFTIRLWLKNYCGHNRKNWWGSWKQGDK